MALTKQTAKMTIEIFQNYKGIGAVSCRGDLKPGTAILKKTAKPLLSLVLEQVAEADVERR